MELLLNLVWLIVSAALGAHLFLAIRRREAAPQGRVPSRSGRWICYLILVALLLPAISMSDDLLAMVAPAEGDRIARRCDASIPGPHHAKSHTVQFLAGPSTFLLVPIGSQAVELLPKSSTARVVTLRNEPGRAPPVILSSF